MKYINITLLIIIFFSCSKDDNNDFSDIIYYDTNEALAFKPTKCKVNNWKDFVQSENYYLNQSLAIYNNYVLEVEEGGRIVILDYKTKDRIGICMMDITDNHANNANFSNIFYEKSDKLPLLYISRCKKEFHECLIYRIYQDENSWNAQLIQSIKTDVNPSNYALSWTIDNDNKIIYCYTYTNGDYDIYEKNNCIFYGWELPEIGQNITLLKENNIRSFEIPYCIQQGAFIYNGLILLNAHGHTHIGPDFGIWAINPTSGKKVWKITPPSKELEGICMYNNKLYTSNRISNQKELIPLTIYEYEF